MTLVSYFAQIGLPGIGLFILLENIGVPLPTETAYIVAQALVTSHKANYLQVIIVFQLAHFIGSWTSYELGFRFRHSQRVRDVEPKISQIQTLFNSWLTKYGLAAVFFSRLIGYVRPWASYIAGAAEIPRNSFLLWSFLGSLTFNVIALSVTRSIVHLWQRYPSTRFAMTTFFFLGVIALIAWEVSHRPKKEQSLPVVK